MIRPWSGTRLHCRKRARQKYIQLRLRLQSLRVPRRLRRRPIDLLSASVPKRDEIEIRSTQSGEDRACPTAAGNQGSQFVRPTMSSVVLWSRSFFQNRSADSKARAAKECRESFG